MDRSKYSVQISKIFKAVLVLYSMGLRPLNFTYRTLIVVEVDVVVNVLLKFLQGTVCLQIISRSPKIPPSCPLSMHRLIRDYSACWLCLVSPSNLKKCIGIPEQCELESSTRDRIKFLIQCSKYKFIFVRNAQTR